MAVLKRLRELPWYVQTGIFFAIGLGVALAGELLPIPVPPLNVKQKSDELDQKRSEVTRLQGEVAVLKETERRFVEFEAKVKAAQQQLELSKAVVPDEKRTDDFMRSIQEAVANARIGIKRLTAKPVVFQQYYAELPMEINIEGGYYNLLDFYERLSRQTRVVNVGELKLDGKSKTGGRETVDGVCTLTTYYTPSEAELAAAAPAGRGAAARGAPAGPPPSAPPAPPR